MLSILKLAEISQVFFFTFKEIFKDFFRVHVPQADTSRSRCGSMLKQLLKALSPLKSCKIIKNGEFKDLETSSV